MPNLLRDTAVCLAVIAAGTAANAAARVDTPDYRNPELPVKARVADLLSRMTIEEKARQMDMYGGGSVRGPGGFSAEKAAEVMGELGMGSIHDLYPRAPLANQIQRYAVENTRLGIPILFIEEGLHGLCAGGYTIFPQAIGMAATWDTDLVQKIGAVIGAESRASGVHECLSPVLGLARDPRWGRTEETYGEDTYLASRMAVAMVTGMQGKTLNSDHTIIAEPKHFAAHSIPEGGRNTAPVPIGERELREVFLPVFRAAFVEGGAMSVMSAYSEIDGVPCTGNKWLLTDVLRGEWGFQGFVLTDLGAISMLYNTHHTAATEVDAILQAVQAGVDMQFYDFGHELFQNGVVELVSQGRLAMADVDRAVGRILTVKFMLGLFDNPYTDETLGPRVIRCEKHRELALRAARETVCLLKNDGDVLPLSKSIRTIAVLGPNADSPRLGDYTGERRQVTVLEGIKAIVPSGTEVLYERGTAVQRSDDLNPIPADFLRTPDGGSHGLKAEYFANPNLRGEPQLVRVDKEVQFDWASASPGAGIPADNFSARWTGKFIGKETVEGMLGASSDDGVRLWIDGEKIIEDWTDHAERTTSVPFRFEVGREYDVRMEFYEHGGGAYASLGWDIGPNRIQIAAETARRSDAAVVVLGGSTRTCGEGYDRTDLELPGNQRELVQAVHATGVPTVVVLLNGRPLTINWTAENVPAIVEAWYPGEAGGTAIAEVLFGDCNPAGRLPITFPKSVGQLPLFYDHKPSARRNYIDSDSAPIFPFGHGLSYTSFEYSGLAVVPDAIGVQGSAMVYVDVTNTGERSGDEVVQLYVTDTVASVTRPVKSLKGFQRIHLAPGEKKTVTFRLGPEHLQLLDRDLNWIVEPGEFRVTVGPSSAKGISETLTVK